MPTNYSDYLALFPKIINAAAAPVVSGIYTLNENNHPQYASKRTIFNPLALPIQSITLISYTTVNPTVTYLLEGTMDGVVWFSLGVPGGTPSVGTPRRDVVANAMCLGFRINVSALSAGNLSCDVLAQGFPV